MKKLCQLASALMPWLSTQAGARGFLARREARRLRQLAAATCIQAAARAFIARSRFLRQRAAALRIQAAYRGHTARSVVADLRSASARLASCNLGGPHKGCS